MLKPPPKVLNVSRKVAENWNLNIINYSWISIQDANLETSTANIILDQYPKLSVVLKEDAHEIQNADAIINFIVNAKGNIIIDCQSGEYNSCAIAKFCEECLGYQWLAYVYKPHSRTKYEHAGQSIAAPNERFYEILVSCYKSKYDK